VSRRHALRARAALLAALLGASSFTHLRAQDPDTRSSTQPTLREQAATAERKGDFARAAEPYLQLCASEPGDVQWVLRGADCLGRSGRFNDALDLLEKARPRFPEVLDVPSLIARTCALKARALIDDGKFDNHAVFLLQDAIRVAEEILARYDGHQEARLILAQCWLDLGEHDKALQHATEASKRFPQHPGGFLLVGQIAFTRYAALRQRVIDEKPVGPALAELQQQIMTERVRAEQALRRAIEIDPERPFAHSKLGDVHAWAGAVDAAAESYARALALDAGAPVNHEWLRQNTKPELRVRLYETAAAAYHKRERSSPARAATLAWYLGYAQLERKEWKAARALFAAAVAGNPDYLNSHHYAMLAAFWDDDHDAAEQHAGAYATASARGFADLVLSLSDKAQAVAIVEFLARRSFEAGRVDRSRDLNHVLAFVQDTAQHWNNYAFLCRETGRYEASFEAYERALEKEPESPQLLNDAAVILHYHLPTKDNLKKARAWYERAVTAAEKALRREGLPKDERERAQQALQDAKGNLAKLPRD
jgi:tetratricopeptide (TPR) repeat protein